LCWYIKYEVYIRSSLFPDGQRQVLLSFIYIYIYEKKTFYVAIKCCTICENSDILFSHTSSWKSNSLWWQLSLFCARNGHFIDPWPQKRVADIYLIKSHNDQWELLIRSPLGFTWPFSSEVWRVLANILIIKQKFMHIYIYIYSEF